MKIEDKPEQGKIYCLFGGKGEPSIAKGNTWAESEVKEDEDNQTKTDQSYRIPTGNRSRQYASGTNRAPSPKPPGRGGKVIAFILRKQLIWACAVKVFLLK